MEPTFYTGQRLLVNKIGYTIGDVERFDTVVCHYPGSDNYYVKRVIGLPGDTIEFSEGQLFVNSRPLSEPYVTSETENMCITLSENEYFVLGDNRAKSYDSRAEDMGCIRRDQFLGRVRWILWPVNRFGCVE